MSLILLIVVVLLLAGAFGGCGYGCYNGSPAYGYGGGAVGLVLLILLIYLLLGGIR